MSRWLENETKLTSAFALISAVSLILSITCVLKDVLPFDIAWAAIILCGVPILVGAFQGVVFEHDIKADVLVAMALVASVVTGEFFAAGEVALIMQIGSLLEDYTSGKARESIEKLIRLSPQKARVIREGEECEVPVEEIRVGDMIRVLAGETIPADGTITEGETTVDQSVMTGESIPVDKGTGDTVSSGTVNRFGTFLMRADRESGDSALQRMIRLAEEAEENKAPIVTLADKWATRLVAAAFACAVATWIFTGEFMRAVTVLVVFCPCAFILATPTAILAGIGNAARYGMIIRSGDALERLSKIKRVAFDKTGTLTVGKPRVTEVVSLSGGFGKEDIHRLAASAEKLSEHPLGVAITESWEGALPKAENFRMIAGRGISARVEGRNVLAGKADFMRAEGVELPAADDRAERCYRSGATVIWLAVDGEPAGFLALADEVRPDAAAVVGRLLEENVTPMLLTGDNARAAETIAARVGITDVRSELLPEDKMEIIREYALGAEPICMIGDGVNDAPALTAADAGIAMGGIGSDIAIESADAVLVSDDIKRVPYLLSLTKKVMQKVKTNIIASMIINITAVVLSAAGVLTPVTGALWHNFGSVFVVVNAAMLLRYRDEKE
ncbi:MAG: cadmium-translocating P-type ATPase [Oscillospiraceae bacterium]|nr:cadmium-translocating P-type ATPase [Oscillospiraceae bacterium]